MLQETLPEGTGSDQDKTGRAMYDQQVAAAAATLRAAQMQQQGAQATLDQLHAIRGRPTALDAAVHKAEGQVALAETALATAQAGLAQVQAPAQPGGGGSGAEQGRAGRGCRGAFESHHG